MAITGSAEPYIFDLPHVLSLPFGFEFRFRYRSEWVSDDLRQEIQDKSKNEELVGSTLILVFHSQEDRDVVLLRRCTVLSIESLGPLFFLRFKVGKFAKVSSEVYLAPAPTDIRKKERARLNTAALGLFPNQIADLGKSLPPGSYLFRTKRSLKESEWADDPPDKAWASLATLVMGERNLRGLPLFDLLGFQKDDGNFVEPSDLKGSFTVSKAKVRGYKLIEEKRYRLRLLEWRDQSMPRYRVICEASPNSIRVVGRSDLVVGRYDILEFSVQADDVGFSELRLRVEPLTEKAESDSSSVSQKNDKREGSIVYSVRIPITVSYNMTRVAKRVIATVLGLALYVASGTINGWILDIGNKFFGISATNFGFAEKFIQLIGLGLILIGFSELLDRTAKARGTLTGLTGDATKVAVN